ncbi:MAG: hypothetical protein ACRDTH_07585 [Pseudonocardiaceae bacterium]
MSSFDSLVAEVLVTAEVSAEEEQAVVEVFRGLGVAVHTRMIPTRRGLEQLHWLVLATLPLHAFLSGLGSTAAQDVAKGLERLIGRVVGTKHKTASSEQVLVLQDAVTRLQVVLEADLPVEAYQELVALNLSAFRQGPVHYDRQRGRWRSELDEWQQAQVKDSGPEY